MNTFHDAEYAQQVMEAVNLVRDALSKTDFDVATNAMMVVLAQYGKLSPLSSNEFIAVISAQVQHLMDGMIVSEYPIQ